MKTLVYYSLGILLASLVFKYIDGSLEKTTKGTVLCFLLGGLLMGAVIKYLEENDAPVLAWVVGMAGVAMLLLILYHALIKLGIPVE